MSNSILLEKNMKSEFSYFIKDKKLLLKFMNSCMNMKCPSYKNFIFDRGYSKMKLEYLFEFFNSKHYSQRGYYGTETAHICSVKKSLESGFKRNTFNHYKNGLELCYNCHDYFDNCFGGAGDNYKKARTTETITSAQVKIENIYKQLRLLHEWLPTIK